MLLSHPEPGDSGTDRVEGLGFEHSKPPAAWLVLSGASAGGFALSFVFSQWFLHAGDFWRTPVLVDLPVAVQCF